MLARVHRFIDAFTALHNRPPRVLDLSNEEAAELLRELDLITLPADYGGERPLTIRGVAVRIWD